MNSSAGILPRISRLWTGSVRRQLVIGVALVHAALMTLFVFDLVDRQREFLHEEAVARAESLAQTLAAASVSWVLANDLTGLEEVTLSLGGTPGLEYATILDPAGRVLSHSDTALVGSFVSDSTSLALLGHPAEVQHLVIGPRQLDVAAPVLAGGRLLGWARIGMNQAMQRASLRDVTRQGLEYTLLAIVVGAGLAWYIALRLSSGLDGLVGVVDRVRAGARNVRADEDRPDEIGRLGQGFNAMLRAVREGEEKFRTVADFTYDWEYWRGPGGRLEWISPSCELYTGYTAEEFMADPELLHRIVHSEDRPIYDAHILEIEGGSIEPGELDFRIRHRGGQTVWIDHHCQDITRPDGMLLGRRVSNRDITLRKHAEEGLRRWARIFENAAWGVVVCDADSGRLEVMNPAFAEMHGATVDELTDRPLEAIIPADARAETASGFRLADLGGHHTFDADHLRGDGTRFPARMDVASVKDVRGRVLYRVINVQDVTERRRSRAELVRAKEAAEAASRAKSDFLAVMSHELRTPLNGIKGMLQIIRDGRLSPDEAREYIGHAMAASDNLAIILNDVLDVSRIEAGKMPVTEEPFRLREAVEPVMDLLGPAAAAKGLAVSLDIDPRLPERVLGDPGRIRQVLLNLLGNAVKFTDEGSARLEIYPLPARDGCDLLPVHFAVIDTGVGIADEQLPNIFEPFTQVESPYTRRHGGVGLGLTVVARLAALMGGRLEVYSEPGVGTEIHLTLPLRALPQEMRLEQAGGQAVKASTLRVLVVEDDPVNRMATLKYLEFLGHAGASASSGQEGLMLMSEVGFDVVLMDIQMPGMDGLETLRRIRAGEDGRVNPRTPVIAVTAHAMRGDRERFLAAGMDGCLAKPYRLEELRATLSTIIPTC
jgi:PAS domain S-box-containing protein